MLTSCDDFLEKNPRDTFVNNPAFWSNNNLVESYANRFYAYYGGATNFYFNYLNDDQVNPSFSDWTFTNVPIHQHPSRQLLARRFGVVYVARGNQEKVCCHRQDESCLHLF